MHLGSQSLTASLTPASNLLPNRPRGSTTALSPANHTAHTSARACVRPPSLPSPARGGQNQPRPPCDDRLAHERWMRDVRKRDLARPDAALTLSVRQVLASASCVRAGMTCAREFFRCGPRHRAARTEAGLCATRARRAVPCLRTARILLGGTGR